MKKNVLTVLTVIGCAWTSFAQNTYNSQNGFWQRTTVEASYGYNLALAPTDGLEVSDYNGFRTLQLGVRVDIDNKWGVRGTYMNTSFQHKDFSDMGIKENKLVAEATYKILDTSSKDPFQVLGHAGFGLGIINSEVLSGDDTVGIFQIGVMPEYKFTDQFAVYFDLTYMMNFSQNYAYSGLGMDNTTGSILVPSIGLSYSLMK